MDLLQETATLFPEEKCHRLSACAALSPDDRQRKGNILLFTVVGGVIWATVIALTVLVLCLFAFCIRILLRNVRRLEDVAERMLPGPLDMGAGKKKQNKLTEIYKKGQMPNSSSGCRVVPFPSAEYIPIMQNAARHR